MAENLKTQTAKGVWWSFLEKYSTQMVTFIVYLFMAKILGPSKYGLIGMISIFISLAQVFIDGGFASALIQKKDRTETDYSTVFWTNISIGLLSYAILFVSAPLISSYFKEEILTPITRIYGINVILASLSAVNKVKLTIAINFHTQLKISLIAACTSGVAGIVCANKGYGVWAIVVQSNVAAIMNTVMSFVYVRWKPDAVFSKESFRSLFSYGSKLLVAQIISAVYTYLYNLAIGKKYSKYELGLYTKAGMFGQMASTHLATVMTRVSFPVLSRVQDDDEKLIGAYRKYIAMVAFIVFPIALGVCGIARPMIVSLISDQWIGCVPFIQILIFAYLCDGITLVNLNLLYVKGKSKTVLKLEVLKKLIAVAILCLTIRHSVTAVCIGQTVYAAIALVLNTRNTRKLLNYGLLKQLRDIFPYLMLSLLVMLIEFGLDYHIDNDWAVLGLSLLLCPIVYLLSCYVLRLNALNEMASIVSSNKLCPSWLNRLLKKLSLVP